MPATQNWNELVTTSQFQTAVAIEQALRAGNVHEATTGVQELIAAMARSDRRALRTHLVRLMAHIIKWESQPDRQPRSRRATIRNARREIQAIQEDTPSLTRSVIESFWDDCFEEAKDDAEGEMEQASTVTSLTWDDVFERAYELE